MIRFYAESRGEIVIENVECAELIKKKVKVIYTLLRKKYKDDFFTRYLGWSR